MKSRNTFPPQKGLLVSLLLVLLGLAPLSALFHAHASRALLSRPIALLPSSRLLRRAATIVASDEDDDTEMMDDDELEIMIWIECPKAGTAIRCYMESSTEIDGKRYALAHPVDIPVIIATCEDEAEGLHAIEDEAEIDAVFDVAKEVLAEEGFDLKRTPFMLTVEEDEEAFDQDELDEEEMDRFEGDEDEDEDVEEGAQVLARFFHAGQQFYVAEPLEPTFVIARQTSGTRFTLLSDEEMERVKPILEQSFIERNKAFDDGEED